MTVTPDYLSDACQAGNGRNLVQPVQDIFPMLGFAPFGAPTVVPAVQNRSNGLLPEYVHGFLR